jgi:hypothetical protein
MLSLNSNSRTKLLHYKQSMIILLLSFLFLNCVNTAFGTKNLVNSEWSQSYGKYRGNSVVQTADGGYAIAGRNATYSFQEYRGYGEFAPLLIKTNQKGEIQWAKTYGQNYGVSESATSIVQTKDNGFLLCGQEWVLKTDGIGNFQWNRTLKSGVRYVAIQTSDQNYLAAGYFSDIHSSNSVSIIYKIDRNGNLLWNKTFNYEDSGIDDILEATDGNYLVVGTWNGNFWFAKTDKDGNLLANLTYHYDNPLQISPETFGSISKTTDGGYILSGGDGGSGWLLKINSEGQEEWHQSYIIDRVTDFSSAIETNSGYIAAGSCNSRALLIKTDVYGTIQWNATYGEGNGDSARSVIAIEDGFVVTGQLNYNVWLAKFALDGSINPSPSTPEIPFLAIIVILTSSLVIIILLYGKKRIKEKKKFFENNLAQSGLITRVQADCIQLLIFSNNS